MIHSTFNPATVDAFDKNKMTFDAQGATSNVTAGAVANIDLPIVDDMLLTGAWFITNGGSPGDSVSFQVVDGSGVFSGTVGTVLNQFITNWYPPSDADIDLSMNYPAKLLAGMTLRVIYTSTGSSTVFVGINYKLHKILV
jgi:hypothetical protein